jgi:hypothetical protein
MSSFASSSSVWKRSLRTIFRFGARAAVVAVVGVVVPFVAGWLVTGTDLWTENQALHLDVEESTLLEYHQM